MSPPLRSPFVAAALVLFQGAAPVGAQLQVSRGTFAPRPDSAERGRLQGLVEVQRAPGAGESDLGWEYRIVLFVPLVHPTRHTELVAQLGQEMWATPERRLSFDPRAAIWEERLALARTGRSGWRWEGGLFWRCRHELDAYDRPDSASGAPTKRVVTLAGFDGGVTSPEWRPWRGATHVRLQLTAQSFVTTDDSRVPKNVRVPRWSDARGSWTLTLHGATRGPARSEPYVRAWHAMVLFREPQREWRAAQRLEGGVRLGGATRPVDLLVAIERTFDDLMRPAPHASRALLLGVRLASHARL